MPCILKHKWNGCKCEKCGKTRDQRHIYKSIPNSYDEECTTCGKTRKVVCTYHNYVDMKNICRQKCSICGDEQPKDHDYKANNCVCAICGKRRYGNHVWDGDNCKNCDLKKISISKHSYSTIANVQDPVFRALSHICGNVASEDIKEKCSQLMHYNSSLKYELKGTDFTYPEIELITACVVQYERFLAEVKTNYSLQQKIGLTTDIFSGKLVSQTKIDIRQAASMSAVTFSKQSQIDMKVNAINSDMETIPKIKEILNEIILTEAKSQSQAMAAKDSDEAKDSNDSNEYEAFTGTGVCDVCNQSLNDITAYIVPNTIFYRSQKYREYSNKSGIAALLGMRMTGADFARMEAKDTSVGSAVCEKCIYMF